MGVSAVKGGLRFLDFGAWGLRALAIGRATSTEAFAEAKTSLMYSRMSFLAHPTSFEQKALGVRPSLSVAQR